MVDRLAAARHDRAASLMKPRTHCPVALIASLAATIVATESCGARTDLEDTLGAAGVGTNVGGGGTDSRTPNPCGPGLQTGAPWAMRGRCVTHTAASPYLGAQTATKKWVVTTGGPVDSSPAISREGTIYIGSEDGNLYAINPDGTIKWKFKTDNYIESSPAIGSDGTIYFGSMDHGVFAVKADGTMRWKYDVGDASDFGAVVASSPAIGADGTVYVGYGSSENGGFGYTGAVDNKVLAINPDGTNKWVFTTSSYVESSPAIGADGTVYVEGDDGTLYAINPDGKQRWAFMTGGSTSVPAIGANGTIYVGDSNHTLYAVNPDGTQSWVVSVPDTGVWSPAIGTDGSIYVGASLHLFAFNADGSERWAFPTGELMSWLAAFAANGALAIGADGTVYMGSVDDNVYAINRDGTQKWSFTTGGPAISAPAIGVDGTIYFGSEGYNVYAIGP
jgi:outer membrane protein assembly factor BamB